MKIAKSHETKKIFQQIPHFEEAHQDQNPGRQLQKIKEAVPGFKEWFKKTGKASAFHSAGQSFTCRQHGDRHMGEQ